MIIGNNNNENKFKEKDFLNSDNKFKTKFKEYKNYSKTHKTNNIFVKDIKELKYSNVNNKDEMYNKSLAMLNERLKSGLITIEEFNKQVKALNKTRK